MPSGLSSSPASPLFIAILPVLLLLGGIIVMFQAFRRRNH
jgi:hypothetical protein